MNIQQRRFAIAAFLAIALTPVGLLLGGVAKAQAPTVRLTADTRTATLCPDDRAIDTSEVRLVAEASDPQGLPLQYKWTVSAGRIVGTGANVMWDLKGAAPGPYTAMVEVNNGRDRDCVAFSSTTINVRECPRAGCPNITVYCPDTVMAGAPLTFTANISGGPANIKPVFDWTVTAGTITSGQGTASITVDTTGLANQAIRATVRLGGFEMDCSATCLTQVPIMPETTRFDEFGDIARDDEKARLDNFAIQLQSDPEATGYVFVYGARRARPGLTEQRVARIREYLINLRGIDPSRVVILEGSPGERLTVELWMVPRGATPPRAR